MSRNVVYRTDQIARHFSSHRIRWDAFYPSERWVFERVAAERGGGFGDVLDVGCAAGGLCLALTERFAVDSYCGVEINHQAAEVARTRSYAVPVQILEGDLLNCPELSDRRFDTVFSLSAADWNVETVPIIEECWRRVAVGGNLIISLRLTPGEGACSMEKSYQYIWFGDAIPDDAEVAPYVVFNTFDALSLFEGLNPVPGRILAYGYWGAPSPTARTPYDALVFAVLAVRKRGPDDESPTVAELNLPLSALTGARRRT